MAGVSFNDRDTALVPNVTKSLDEMLILRAVLLFKDRDSGAKRTLACKQWRQPFVRLTVSGFRVVSSAMVLV